MTNPPNITNTSFGCKSPDHKPGYTVLGLFDVVIGNPPYQMSDGGHGSSARPIYNLFFEKALLANPEIACLIIPSRWMSGGKGLSGFRARVLSEKRIKSIVDYHNSKDCFPEAEIEGGICILNYNKGHSGGCRYSFNSAGESETYDKDLSKHDFLVRGRVCDQILDKVVDRGDGAFQSNIFPRNPFGIPTNFKGYSVDPHEGCLLVHTRSGKYLVDEKFVTRNTDIIHKYKVCVSKANGAAIKSGKIISNPFIALPGEVCTETYLVLYVSDSLDEASKIIDYINTKFFRFLLGIKKITQNNSRETFSLIPEFKEGVECYYRHYGLTKHEIDHIESSILEMPQ